MNAYEYITRLETAKYGNRRVSEDAAPVAPAPSHAPTSGTDATTKGQGKSEDEGEEVKKAYKQPSGSIPAPVAAAPSHAPTSGEDYTTKGQGSSQDKGEAVKKAMKEAVNQLLDGDSSAIDSFLGEGGHKAGCTCGFCKNKGKFGKKKSEDDGESDCDKADKPMDENLTLHPDTQPPRPGGDRIGFRKPLSRPDRLKGERGLEGWRRGPKQNPSLSRHYAGGKPGTPSMECLNTNHTIQSIADRFLDYPA